MKCHLSISKGLQNLQGVLLEVKLKSRTFLVEIGLKYDPIKMRFDLLIETLPVWLFFESGSAALSGRARKKKTKKRSTQCERV